MRAVYIGVELSNGLVFRGLIKTRERNSLMKDTREYAIATRLQNHGDKSDHSTSESEPRRPGFSLRPGKEFSDLVTSC